MSVSPIHDYVDPITTTKQRNLTRVVWSKQRITSLINAVNDRIKLFREQFKGTSYKNECVRIKWQLISDTIRDLTDPSDIFEQQVVLVSKNIIN